MLAITSLQTTAFAGSFVVRHPLFTSPQPNGTALTLLPRDPP
jgi:hypothetical protein